MTYDFSISGEKDETNNDGETENQKINTQQKEVITKCHNLLKYRGFNTF